MIIALVIFLITYALMLSFQQYRPWIALTSAAIFIILGYCGLFSLTLPTALAAVDYNVLLMIGGTMGTVTLFIESRMPARLAELLITKVPNVKWAVTALALFAGVISALFCWADFLFRKEKQEVSSKVETEVTDMVPSYLMIATVLLLICASFIPEPTEGIAAAIYGLRSGLICLAICIVGVIYTCIRTGSGAIVKKVIQDLDRDTLLLLFGLFMVIEGIKQAGVIDAIAQLFFRVAGESPFLLYTLIVFASVFLSAFIDNIPYVATMLPVVESISGMMGVEPYVFYFGLLTGATLGGNLTPIGASANIAAIGILRKNGEIVKVRDFLRIGIPFTMSAVLTGYIYIWLVWGI